jgi:hypothetical protein
MAKVELSIPCISEGHQLGRVVRPRVEVLVHLAVVGCRRALLE